MRTLSFTSSKTGPKFTRTPVIMGALLIWLCILGSSARAALPNPGFQMKLSGMLTDYDRPYVYGLHPGSGTAADAFLLAINPTSGEVEKFLPVGTNPTDFTLNRQEGRLYVTNHGFDQTQVVDLDSFTLLPPLRLGTKVFLINAGQEGTIFYMEDGFSGNVYKANTRNGQVVTLNRLDKGQAEFNPSGTFYYHAESSSSNSQIMRFDVRNGNYALLNQSRERREPIRNLVISPDGSRLFWASHVYDADLNELRALPGDIHATAASGEIAFTSTEVIRTESGQAEANLPFSTTVMAESGDSSRIVLFDPAGNRVVPIELSDLVDLPGPRPRDNDTVSLDEAADLSWTPVPDSVSYKVFLSKDRSAVAGAHESSVIGRPVTSQLAHGGSLTLGERYFWRADAVRADSTITPGTIWTFVVGYPVLKFDFTPISSGGGNALGNSVAISDRIAVSGAPGHALGEGKALVWERAPGTDTWMQSIVLNNPSPGRDFGFGKAVAVNSHYVAVAAPRINVASSPGEVSVYSRQGGTWKLTATLKGPVAESDRFGSSLAMDDRHLVISAPQKSVQGHPWAGVIYVYQVGTWKLLAELPQPNPGQNGLLGITGLAMSGNTIAAGNYPGGKVYLFEKSPSSDAWSLTQTLSSTTGTTTSFGSTLALGDRFLAIGNPTEPAPSILRIYERGPDRLWKLSKSLQSGAATPIVDDRFGHSVSVAGDRVFAGAPGPVNRVTDDGNIYSFRPDPAAGPSEWRSLARITTQVDTSGWGRGLGTSLAVNGNYSMAGLPWADPAPLSDGAVMFHKIGDGNHPPLITSTPFGSAAVGSYYSYRITTSDEDPDDPVGVKVTEAPQWLTLAPDGASGFRLTGTVPEGAQGEYTVILEATDGNGATNRQIFALKVGDATGLPTITEITPGTVAYEHQALVLSVRVTSPVPASFQWHHNDIPIEGATDSVLHLDPIDLADAGEYRVSIHNSAGSILSGPIAVTVEQNDRIGGNWTTFGRDSSRSGYYPATLGDHRFLQKWSNPVTVNYSIEQPSIALGQVFATVNHAPAAQVFALDFETGATRWVASFADGKSKNATTYHKGRIYVQGYRDSSTANLWCLDARTGAPAWTKSFPSSSDSFFPPAVSDQTIFMANGSTLDAFMLDGTLLFRRTTGIPGYRSWGPTLTSAGRLFTWVRGQLAEHDPDLGLILWSNQSAWSSFENDINRLVAISGDRAVVSGSADGGVSHVKCFDLVANQLLWQSGEPTVGTPAIAGNEVFVVHERGVKSLSLADGRPVRDYQTGGESLRRLETQPIVLRDAVLVSSETKTYIFGRESGLLLQTIPHGGPIAFSDNHLFIASIGTLHSYYANRAPGITGNPPTSVNEDEIYSAALTLLDDDGDDIVVTPLSLPGFLQWSRTGDVVTLTGVPEARDVGRHEVKFRITDSAGISSDFQVQIEVIFVDDLPTATEIPPDQAVEDSSDLRVRLPDYFDDEEDGMEGLTYSIVAGNPDPANILTNLRIENGTLRFDLVPDAFGPSGCTLRATDRAGQSVELVYSIDVLELVDLALDATTSTAIVGGPGTVTHTITVQNLGPSNATSVRIDLESVVPSGVSAIAPAPTTGTVSGGVWQLDLPEGRSASVALTYLVAVGAAGKVDSITTSGSLAGLDQPLANVGDDSGEVASSIVSPADMGILKLDPTPRLNLQSGLLSQRVTITNNNPLPIAGFCLAIKNLPADTKVQNADGKTDEGIPLIFSAAPMEPGMSITLTVEFFIPSRNPNLQPDFQISAVYVVPPGRSAPGGATVESTRVEVLDNGEVLLEFPSIPGAVYAINYSEDMKSWHRVSPTLTATANRTQWIDNGPPKTASPPSSVPKRYYRIVTQP
jgi:hypothetical protein